MNYEKARQQQDEVVESQRFDLLLFTVLGENP
jgi:hypothetical protein